MFNVNTVDFHCLSAILTKGNSFYDLLCACINDEALPKGKASLKRNKHLKETFFFLLKEYKKVMIMESKNYLPIHYKTCNLKF